MRNGRVRCVLITVGGERMVDVTNVFVEAFFDRFLLGEEAPILDELGGEWPEVVLIDRSDV